MDIRSHIMRFRTDRRKSYRSNPSGLIGFLFALLISLAAAASVITGVVRYAEITTALPPPELIERLLDPFQGSLLQATRIYDRSGQSVLWEFENPLIQSRRYSSITDGRTLFYSDVSEHLINGILASRDPEYFSRPGSFPGMILETSPDPIPRELVQELLLWNETGHPYREVRTDLLAAQIVARFGRQKVLEWYLNRAYFGNQIYGIEQAAQVYFRKPAAYLDLAESALLAGVASYPSLNPYDSPEAAKENQEAVLNAMLEAGWITRGERDQAAQKQLIYPDPDAGANTWTPAFVDYVLKEAQDLIPREVLVRGGYKIISTLDGDLQHELECTTALMIARSYGGDPELDPACQSSRLLLKYTGPIMAASEGLEIDLVLLDPISGEVLGLAGQSDQGPVSNLDRGRNPGTSISPFIYLTHFTQGFGPASLVWDIPLEDLGLEQAAMHPGCTLDCDFKGPVNIRTALVNDYLSPAQQLWDSEGGNQILRTLALFGFSLQGEYCLDCTLFPGSPELDIIDLAQGYGVFVNQGFLRGRRVSSSGLEIQPASILRLEDLSGWYSITEPSIVQNKVISEQLAYLMNDILSDDSARTDGDIFQIGSPAGVKAGYLPAASSAWTLGYTPGIVVAVWAGDPQGEGRDPGTYQQISATIWRAITQQISREQDPGGWEMPAGIVTLDVCYPSGQLPTENCPREVREIFIQGNEPQGGDTLFRTLEVNRETGLLASVFTPAQLIEERVYLNFPAEALAWAEAAGLAAPPTLYDLDPPEPSREGLAISSPENLSFVRGRVRIVGSIPEENFQSARLQFGAGMNPGSWLQIGQEITSPAQEVWLESWDTADLADGVYALQLVLITADLEVEKASLIVSVDNTIPEISLLNDLAAAPIEYRPGREIIFEVAFENSSEIAQVDFFLDGEPLGSRAFPPYLLPWINQPGSHRLRVTATDLAGNRAELEVEFEVVRE